MFIESQVVLVNSALLRNWNTFKCETLQSANECNGKHLWFKSDFAVVEMLESIEESNAGRRAGNED